MAFAWLFFLQEIAGKPVAPSWGAWAGIVFGGGSFILLVYDKVFGKGKAVQRIESKLETLCEDFEDLKETQGVMDGHLSSLSTNVQALTHEWRGVDGRNGWKSIVKTLRHEVTDIQKRNLAIDAVTQYEHDQLRKHGKRPERMRDKLMRDEDADDN